MKTTPPHNRETNKYVSALRVPLLNRFYDPFLVFSGLGNHFRERITTIADLESNVRTILDVGCGTGSHIKVLREYFPEASLTGIDPDEELLAIAKAKVHPNDSQTVFVHGSAESLPFTDKSFDACFSTLALHHMSTQNKQAALQEIYRILKPGGIAIITDWGPTRIRLLMYFNIFEERKLLEDHFSNKIPKYATDIGFAIENYIRVKPSGIWTLRLRRGSDTQIT